MVELAHAKRSCIYRQVTSMGLGLFVAREIVRAHRAEIYVLSSEVEGTVFKIRMSHAGRTGRAEVGEQAHLHGVTGPS